MVRWGEAAIFAGSLLLVSQCKAEPISEVAAPRQKVQVHDEVQAPNKILVGVTPYFQADDVKREYTALFNHISTKLGIPIEIRSAATYSGLVDLVINYQVQMAVLSPFAYVKAKHQAPDLVLLATHIAEGSSSYAAYIVGRQDAPSRIEDMKGKKFAFVDRQSASGFLYPLAYLRGRGLEPQTFFSAVTFSGNHAKLLQDLASKKIDAGATFSSALKLSTDTGKTKSLEEQPFKILAKTGRIPYDAYCVSPKLPESLRARIKEILLSISTRDEEGRNILGGPRAINGFVEVNDSHYDDVRQVEKMIDGPMANAD